MVLPIREVIASGVVWSCTNRHGILAHAEFIEDEALIEEHIDWDAMQAQYWKDDNDPDLKARRQAEFLIRDRVPLSAFTEIGAINKQVADRVQNLLRQTSGITLSVQPKWYF